MKSPASILCLAVSLLILPPALFADEQPADSPQVSFSKQIHPIFQAKCQGCHQPAKASGSFVMTDFDKLLGGGESEEKAIVPGKPDESYLVLQITPEDGSAAMPPKGDALSAVEIDLIRKWIEQGARNDSPNAARVPFSRDNPPVYSMPPVITSLDFSPDGSLLAVAGFHEVLLHRADGSELVDRLIGISERIESVRFSPDGKRLAVTGGQPGRMGEVQVWDVEKRELLLSHSVTYDTIYGASWSPDGTLIAFGGSDNIVRAINAETGEQVLQQGAHSDWIRDTVFTTDGSHLLSVARDMTVKLTEVSTNRFIDNVTSITPGALKGGINSIARHPERDEVVVGGSDGTPKVYRVFRITARQIGDDANLIRTLDSMTGRVFGVAVSRDGTRIAAVSALDGQGELAVHSYEFDTNLPDDLKAISAKRVAARSAEEQQKLDEYRSKDIKRIAQVSVPESALYALSFHPNNRQVATAGGDGTIRLYDTESGQLVASFAAAPVSAEKTRSQSPVEELVWQDSPLSVEESLPEGASVVSLEVTPSAVALPNPFEYAQLLISATLDSGDVVDVTRIANVSVHGRAVEVTKSGFVRPQADGTSVISVTLGSHAVQIPVAVAGFHAPFEADFIEHVNPVLSRVGCNQGTCHGSKDGKNGFKLSLRGYDPIYDVRALTDDLAARRTNIASPADSLMLLKATGVVPHVGQQVIRPNSNYYEIVRSWIAGGAKLNGSTPKPVSIEIVPQNPVIQQLRSTQQIRIVATYADGRTKDVTREAYIDSGNTEVAATNRWGLVTALRRGEAPILARYEGSYAATTLTVMGDRSGFEWKEPETWSEIDRHVAAKWQRMKIEPSEVCSDEEYLRRVHLDLTGLPPTAEQVRAFLADSRETRIKRAEVVDQLVGSDAYVEYWSNKWADLLQVNSKFLGPEGAVAFRDWIRSEVKANTPYDEFVRKVITADGSNKEHPAASYFKILREPTAIMENTTHLFLGVRFNCNKCHDHPFERWTQDQYYETAAYFARVGLKQDPASGDRRIGGTAVEGAKPYYEIVYEKDDGEVVHDRTRAVTAPEFPYECDFSVAEGANRRQRLAAWITSPDNRYFAKSYVNRLWGYLLGVGIMEPIDDLRAGNPPTNPELLDHLTNEFINSGFNVRHVVGLICKSRTYQLSLETNRWNADDEQNYSHAIARRLPAEVLYDSIHQVTGSVSKIPGVPDGTRAAAIPDAGIELPDGFLANLGRPVRESACECERSADLQLGPIMALIGGPTVGTALADPDNAIASLVREIPDDRQLIDEIFVRILNRPATDSEIDSVQALNTLIDRDHEQLVQQLAAREEWWVEEKPKLEQAREAAIAEATADLKAFEEQIAPRRAEEEKVRLEKLAEVEADYNNYKAAILNQAESYLTEKSSTDAEWHLLEAISLEAVSGITLERQEDRSIKATGSADRGAYTVTVRTSLKDIAAFRIEALTDAGIKGNGPGLPENGNFVVTEFDVQAAPSSDPGKMTKVELQNAKASFLQAGFNIDLTIDGNAGNQNGWAIANAGGVAHWATFETKQPVSHDGGTIFKFTIHQNHDAKNHLLGRFRISATTKPQPGLSLPESLQSISLVKAEQRSDGQKQTLLSWIEKTDPTLLAKQTALNEARKPLPEDPGVTSRKEKLTFVSQEVPEDSRLVQMRSDVEFSTKQQESKRLTMAQDLAWALINNPAFLFNH
ncbi:MAG: LpqB family beta-propeller domain-containing protein [Planctomycetaceae bacterium]